MAVEIPLTRGKFAIVDAADEEALSRYSWSAIENPPGSWYARAEIAGRTVYLHRFLMGEPEGMTVDHVDGNGLHNTRNNLRICTHAQNQANRKGLQKNNTTGFVGVVRRRSGRYGAEIKHEGKKIRLGTFDSAIEAAAARDKAAIQYHGEFAYLNLEIKQQ